MIHLFVSLSGDTSLFLCFNFTLLKKTFMTLITQYYPVFICTVPVYNFHNKLLPHILNSALYICNRSKLFNSSAHLLSLGQSGTLPFYSN